MPDLDLDHEHFAPIPGPQPDRDGARTGEFLASWLTLYAGYPFRTVAELYARAVHDWKKIPDAPPMPSRATFYRAVRAFDRATMMASVLRLEQPVGGIGVRRSR